MTYASHSTRTMRLLGLLLIPLVFGCGWLGNAVPDPDPLKVAELSSGKKTESGPSSLPNSLPSSPSDSTSDQPAEVSSLNPPTNESFQPIETFAAWDLETTVADALARIGAPAVPELVRALRDPDPVRRVQALRVLTRIGPEARDAVPTLTELLQDPHPLVRKQAARALGQLGPEAAAAIPALMELLRQTQDTNQERRTTSESVPLGEPSNASTAPPISPPSPSFYQRTSPTTDGPNQP